MNIITTQYSLKYRSLEIVLAGCKGCNGKHCEGCHSPETWDFNQGDNYKDMMDDIVNKLIDFDNMINWVWVYGGEPLDQDNMDLMKLLRGIKQLDKEVVLFTRYPIESIPKLIREYCDYIKCGEYKPELAVDNNVQYGITLATSNQKIYKKGINF